MKILLAGNWISEIHEEQLFRGLVTHPDVSVYKFTWSFQNIRKFKICNFLLKIEDKILIGPATFYLNLRLLFKIYSNKPNYVFLYRPIQILPFFYYSNSFINKKSKIILYNNDDTFSKKDSNIFRHILKSLKYVDLALAYRPQNHKMYKELKINSELFLPWYDKDLFKAYKKTKFKYDVVFVGHYENDIRLECLKHLHIKGLKIGLFGPIEKVHSGWKSTLINTDLEYLLNDLRYLNLEEYYNVLRQSKVALCFFSKRNNDVYTRRSFEIPASGTIMLSEYSDEISKIFLPDLDSFYFKDLESFKNQVDIIFSNEFDLNKIENNIINKLKQIKMSNYDRANQLIEYLKKIN